MIQSGDLVVRVATENCRYGSHTEEVETLGVCGRVVAIFEGEPDEVPQGDWAQLDSRDDIVFCVGCLRKIDPASDEFIEQIRSLKPLCPSEEERSLIYSRVVGGGR